jgi:hypothetical protein
MHNPKSLFNANSLVDAIAHGDGLKHYDRD